MAGSAVGGESGGDETRWGGRGGTGGIALDDEVDSAAVRSAGSDSRRRGFEFPRLSLKRWTILENRERRPRGASPAGAGASTDAADDSDERVRLSVDVDAELSD